MASPQKELNKHRQTICKNCLHFDNSKRFYKTDMCSYYDIEANADNDCKCSVYEEFDDPI